MPPPTRLHVTIQSPDGTTAHRWGIDEPDAQNAPSAVTFSSTMPGGFEQASLTLPRQAAVDYPDLDEFSRVTIRGAGGEVAWQGRLETTPRTSGDQLAISPGLTGYQAALTDNQAAREIYIDCNLAQWQAVSVQRQLSLAAAAFTYQDPSTVPDATTGQPSVALTNTGPWTTAAISEAFYDAHGLPIASLYYAWKLNANVSPADTNWNWYAYLANDDVAAPGGLDSNGNLRAAGPGSGVLSATTATRRCGLVQFYYGAGPIGNDGVDYTVFWTYLGIVGRHGLTIRGTLGATGGIGVYASDVVAHAVVNYAPAHPRIDAGGNSTIEATNFLIPQLVFTDPTTAANIITQATQYGLEDWWVDEGPTFHLASRANHGRDWQARVGPSGLQETGPQVDRIYNGAVVSYTDVSGIVRTVGPPGSGANTEDSSLFDADPQNPATEAGITRNSPPIAMGTSTTAAAIKVGQAFLIEQKALSTAGQASLVGYVADSTGVRWPAWMVRAGDRITFVDAHDPVPRRVVRAAYDDASRTCQVDLDSPPEGLAPLLARLSVDLAPLGLA